MRVAMVVLVLAVMGGASAAAERPPSPPPGSGGLAVGQAFWWAVNGTPTEYLFCRAEILEAGESARAVLAREREQRSGPWLGPALAAAMLQRMDEPDEVRLLEGEFGTAEAGRHQWWAVRAGRGVEPERCRERWAASHIVQQGERSVPFLIEKLFKQPPREIADPTVVGHHPSDPRGAASCLLRLIAGKPAARAVAVFLLIGPETRVPPGWWEGPPTPLGVFDRAAMPDRVLELARLTDQQLVYEMLSALDDDKRQLGAAWVLGELRDPRAVPSLVDLLARSGRPWPENEYGGAEFWPAEALAKIGQPAIPIVERIYRSGPGPRGGELAIVRALRAIGGRKTAPLLLEMFRASHGEVKTEAAVALGRAGDPAAIPLLTLALGDPNFRVRASSAWALGELCTEPPERLVTMAQGDPEKEARQAAAEALARITARAGGGKPGPSQGRN